MRKVKERERKSHFILVLNFTGRIQGRIGNAGSRYRDISREIGLSTSGTNRYHLSSANRL